MSTSSDVFCTRLRLSREMRCLSQSELAAKAGLPPTSISHFESGTRKPSFDNLRRLAIALEITADYLMGSVDDTEQVTDSDPLYRDVKKLSAADRELTRDFVQMLSKRSNKKSE